MIARVNLGYGAQDLIPNLINDPASLHLLQGVFGSEMPSEENRDKGYYWPRELLIDLDTDGPVLVNLGIKFEVLAYKGCMNLKDCIPEGSGGRMDGRDIKIMIQVPHVGLLAIDEVEVIEDACTYALQSKLEAGWRILAVCPPNAQRRPDYILGRTKGDPDDRRR